VFRLPTFKKDIEELLRYVAATSLLFSLPEMRFFLQDFRLRSLLFWIVARRPLVTDVSEQLVDPIFKVEVSKNNCFL
jgi:hypothetical protein